MGCGEEGGVTGGVVRREHREKNVRDNRHKPHTTYLFSTHVQIRAPVRTQCTTCSCYSTFPPSTTHMIRSHTSHWSGDAVSAGHLTAFGSHDPLAFLAALEVSSTYFCCFLMEPAWLSPLGPRSSRDERKKRRLQHQRRRGLWTGA